MQENIALKRSRARIMDLHNILQGPFLDFDCVHQLEVRAPLVPRGRANVFMCESERDRIVRAAS
jgi:hypothetical protein